MIMKIAADFKFGGNVFFSRASIARRKGAEVVLRLLLAPETRPKPEPAAASVMAPRSSAGPLGFDNLNGSI